MVLILTLCLWAAALVAHLSADLPVGRACRSWVVERPAAWLARRSAVELAGAALFVLALLALAPSLPIESALLAAGDMSAYLDLLVLVAATTLRSVALRRKAALGLGTRLRVAARRIGFTGRSGRERRPRPPRRPGPSTDDERSPVFGAPAFA